MIIVFRDLLEIISFIVTINGLATLSWMLYAWRDESSYEKSKFPIYSGNEEVPISIIVPARHEETVLKDTLLLLSASKYTNFEVIVVIGHDDPSTMKVAEDAIKLAGRNFRIAVDTNTIKNKPSALNTGLEFCSGELIGIIDAEDEVSINLLTSINAAYQIDNPDIIQGSVQLVNLQSTWFSARNCLEYYLWFRSRLQWQAKNGFVPLGGNSVFIRRSRLISIGGWDPNCLTEDCDLGVRLATQDCKVRIGFDPDTTTREETPLDLKTFVRQRTRWNQGFVQIYRKGDWKNFPSTKSRLLARYTLMTPFLQAFNTLSFLLAVIGIFYLVIGENQALFMFLPMLILFITLAFEMLSIYELGKEFNIKIALYEYVNLMLFLLPYQLLLSLSAANAIYRHLFGKANWQKTDHVGAHREDTSNHIDIQKSHMTISQDKYDLLVNTAEENA